MTWLKNRKKMWRMSMLLLLIISLIGPWGFDKLHIPAAYPCGASNIRLSEEICGMPIPGLSVLLWSIGNLMRTIRMLLAGHEVTHWVAMFWHPLGLFVALLPMFSLALLVVSGGEHPRRRFHLGALGLTVSLATLFLIFIPPNGLWAAWGMWLFVGAMAIGLILEIVS